MSWSLNQARPSTRRREPRSVHCRTLPRGWPGRARRALVPRFVGHTQVGNHREARVRPPSWRPHGHACAHLRHLAAVQPHYRDQSVDERAVPIVGALRPPRLAPGLVGPGRAGRPSIEPSSATTSRLRVFSIGGRYRIPRHAVEQLLLASRSGLRADGDRAAGDRSHVVGGAAVLLGDGIGVVAGHLHGCPAEPGPASEPRRSRRNW